MKALVVYDSVFGNTEKAAQAIGAALGTALAPQTEVHVLRVGDVKLEHLTGLDVLLVGSPTRAFSATPAIKTWLRRLAPNSLKGVKVAAFDTRADLGEVNSPILTFFVKLFGYAAEPMARRLVKKGGVQAMPAEGFIVKGTEGPLKDGELERAAAWARQAL
jgi:flavodoxin